MKIILLPLLSGFAILLASCASSSPTTRIQNNPVIFQKVPSSQREMVVSGRIKNGMSKDAVFIAWGKPDSVAEGETEGKRFERWTYTSLSPVYSTSFYGGYGGGYGGYGCHNPYYRNSGYGSRGYGYVYSQAVDYVPVPSATVDFSNGRVTKWQRGRLPN
ncbi:hypothetical protein N9085_01395 [Akkermansiaceae bacterium]|nr:hypothetical protein [Akkermansiaceae bacterium]MDB4585463.1 hypothetical protein [Akkermansiaceae bacterium]